MMKKEENRVRGGEGYEEADLLVWVYSLQETGNQHHTSRKVTRNTMSMSSVNDPGDFAGELSYYLRTR